MATEESQGMNLDEWERRAADSSTLFELVDLEAKICNFIMTNPAPPEESRERLVAVITLVEKKFQSAMTMLQAEITQCRKKHEDIIYAIRTAQNRQKMAQRERQEGMIYQQPTPTAPSQNSLGSNLGPA